MKRQDFLRALGILAISPAILSGTDIGTSKLPQQEESIKTIPNGRFTIHFTKDTAKAFLRKGDIIVSDCGSNAYILSISGLFTDETNYTKATIIQCATLSIDPNNPYKYKNLQKITAICSAVQ